jgi:hypothetical protein
MDLSRTLESRYGVRVVLQGSSGPRGHIIQTDPQLLRIYNLNLQNVSLLSLQNGI